ncbi:multidrug resistance protein 4 [Suillus subalutaceus]|uniref:multidrug resistance protein 4 n=1 Tax=Suillus subalutaceus TaxID=48586 RepID=UPI001B865215|nr:multidrug resistance protein 4 [Suillus subalutaceus]KAG1850204.1 multidrug resistance protein 4 [Suillus subalutaceus]
MSFSGDNIPDKFKQLEDGWQQGPANPRNWSPARKWTTTAIVVLYTFVTPLASSIMTPGLPGLAIKFGITDPTVTALTLSIFLLSFAIGLLFAAPLSEVYGRVWVLHLGNLFFLGFNLGCAFSPNTTSFLLFRFLAGLAGGAPVGCGGGGVSDLFSEHDRAAGMALYNVGPLIVLASSCYWPVVGGFMAESVGIQYDFYFVIAICGIAAVLGIPFMRESYALVIRIRREKDGYGSQKGVRRTSRHHHTSHGQMDLLMDQPQATDHAFDSEFYMFYPEFIHGSDLWYLLPDVCYIPQLLFGISGLTYIGLGFGFISATIFGVKLSGKIYIYLATQNGGKGKPEMRIPALIFGSFFVPLVRLVCPSQDPLHDAHHRYHYLFFGFGFMTVFLPIQLYLVDTFIYAASATAAASSSLLGFAFPLFGQQMFAVLGYGGGNSLLAGLAIVIGIPFPIWIYYAGERIRAGSSLTR